jgi:hypothetical protein
MWSFKNVVAIGLFLFGSTFLWMTPTFAGKTPPPTGAAWTAVNVLALLTVAGFTVTAWAVFKEYSWWSTVAIASASIGLLAIIPFVVALRQIDMPLADLGVQINVWMHVLGTALVLAALTLSSIHDAVVNRF